MDESFGLQQLCSLKPNKAIGLDRISARLLKCASFSICSSVTKLLNLSIRTSRFPEIWQCSKVTTLFKSGDQTNVSKYRPISILPTLSKILERAVHLPFMITWTLTTCWPTSKLVSDLTVTALAIFADDVLSNMERGNLCEAVFLDLSKAFYTVNHSILLAKLSSLGLTPNAVQWFQTYLISVIRRSASHTAKRSPILYLLPMVYHMVASWGPSFFLFT